MSTFDSIPLDLKTISVAIQTLVKQDAFVMIQGLQPQWHYCVRGDKVGMIMEMIKKLHKDGCGGIYWSINPLRDFEGCAENSDVIRRHSLLIDIDRMKASAEGQPATDAEKQQVLDLANDVKRYLISQGLPDPLVVDSGNGVHLFWRIDMDNNTASKSLISEFLHALAGKFGAQIDTSVCDARRIIRIPGTVNRKGCQTPDRPHRVSKFLNIPTLPQQTVPAELLKSIVASIGRPPLHQNRQPFATSSDAPERQSASIRPGDDFNRRATWDEILTPYDWIKYRELHDKTEWTRPGKDTGCSATTGYCKRERSGEKLYLFTTMAEPFVQGVAYDKFAAFAILSHGSDFKAASSDLANKGYGKKCGESNEQQADASKVPQTPLGETPDDPDRLARIVLNGYSRNSDGVNTLRYWKQRWMIWTDGCYLEKNQEDFKYLVRNQIKADIDAMHQAALSRNAPGQIPKLIKVTLPLVANVIEALKSQALLPMEQSMQSWLGETSGRHDDMLAFENGLVDLRSHFSNNSALLHPPSPEWFSQNKIACNFDPAAKCPKWTSFLQQSLEGDWDRINVLQEWFGLNLVYDTSFQKFLMLVGDGANGKSVICGALRAILGSNNCSSVALESFGDKYKLASTLGKLANIVSECGEIDRCAEGILKAFVSGDLMSFERKYCDPINAVPTARFTLATNNQPRFSDRTMGIWRRMILMPLNVTIRQSDRILGMDKPNYWVEHGEVPGMVLWALQGLRRLRLQKDFSSPKVCEDAKNSYQTESNPARLFLSETCEQQAGHSILVRTLYGQYRKWCIDRGYQPLSDGKFGKEVRMVFKQVQKKKTSVGGAQVSCYYNISWGPPWSNPGHQPVPQLSTSEPLPC